MQYRSKNIIKGGFALTDNGLVVVHDGRELVAPPPQDERVVDVVVEALPGEHGLLLVAQPQLDLHPPALQGDVEPVHAAVVPGGEEEAGLLGGPKPQEDVAGLQRLALFEGQAHGVRALELERRRGCERRKKAF